MGWVLFMAHQNNVGGEPEPEAEFVYLTPGRGALSPTPARSAETLTPGRSAATLTGERLK